MDSSFLTWVNVGLGLYSGISFFRMIIQFGLPNHPGRFTLYLVCLCAMTYFSMKALTGLGILAPIYYLKWRPLPLVAGSLALLLQVISTSGQFSLIQQKVISRIPLMAGLLVFAFFPMKADLFAGLAIMAGGVFLSISVGKARYQKRMYFKMVFFLAFSAGLSRIDQYWTYVLGEMVLFIVLFYFFIFEQTFGVSSLVEGHQHSREGDLG